MKHRGVFFIALIVVAFIAGFFTHSLVPEISNATSKQVRLGEGRLTNPLLECEIAQGTIDAEKINFKSELEKFVRTTQTKNNIKEIGLYFRDLNNGPTFGINQDDPFVPASLLKVPVMMAFFKRAEADPTVLSKKLLFSKSRAHEGQQTILPAQRLVEGKEYSVQELIERMVIYSDNEALILLFEELPTENHVHLYKLLGVDTAVITNPTASLSVKQYAAFFRILYNSSFLSQESSEKALELLSNIDFKGGMRARIPESISIAHKFGERQINTGERHLHDCGIVYYPKHPYLLCIMTRGGDVEKLTESIADISSFVYEKIDAQYR